MLVDTHRKGREFRNQVFSPLSTETASTKRDGDSKEADFCEPCLPGIRCQACQCGKREG